MQSHTADIAIIGAGAAGLAAGIFAGEANLERDGKLRIVILDSARTIGAKILVSGGGRCNVTHAKIKPGDFNGSQNVVKNVLAAFDERRAVRWFDSMGVQLKQEETGKLFPVSDQARTVLDALLKRCAALNVEILADHRVTDVRFSQGHFELIYPEGMLHASRVIFATGGRSLPKTGSDGAGWSILRRLGHQVTDTHAALVPLVLDSGFFHAQISGLSHEAELSTWVEGKRIDRRTDSLLWTHFGISGPVAMDASRHWTIARDHGKQVEMRCNLLPDETMESFNAWLVSQIAQRNRSAISTILAEKIPSRLAEVILTLAKIDPMTTLSQFSKESRRNLTKALIDLPLPIQSNRGWNYAEVTAGGVPLSEIDYRTMESRIVPGLYLIGELLDVDGRIGGFNFQWAWATGYLAGKGAINSEC